MTTDRRFSVATPLGQGVLLLKSMNGHEALGNLFRYELELLSEDAAIDPNRLLGERMTISVQQAEGAVRNFSGVVTSFGEGGDFGRYALYHAVLEPWLALLDLSADCRIFQAQAVPDIMKQVFRDLGFSAFAERMYETYPEWDFMSQYRESAFAFVSRLMEQEGIYYYFKHTADGHDLVLADSPSSHAAAPGFDEILYYAFSVNSERRDEEHISGFHLVRQIQSGAYATSDFDFKRPKVSLLSKASDPAKHTHADIEVYDYPGEFVEGGAGATLAKRRLQELAVGHERYEGSGNVSGVGAGHTFKLTNHPVEAHNQEYLVVSCQYALSSTGFESSDEGLDERFDWSFSAISAKRQYRTPSKTRKPHIRGPQTAVVVGPAGEEIWVDEFGRIKVQFHWDRAGKKSENSSCWVRVSQAWAGPGFGAVHWPRIGQEVVVEFLEGDPDRPLVTGRVYNADNMPPYKLPDNKTQSGIKSRSSKGGAADNANEIRFEDKRGSELFFTQAEKDMETLVKNDEQRTVRHNRKKDVTNDETTTIGANRTESVGKSEAVNIGENRALSIGDNHDVSVGESQSTSVGKDNSTSVGGDNSTSVGGNNNLAVDKDDATTVTGAQSISVSKDRSLSISGAHTITVSKDENHTISGKHSTKIGKDGVLDIGKKMTITVGDQLTIKVGKASITMKKDGSIAIDGKDIKLNGSGKIDIKASSDVKIKGSKVGQN